MNCEIDSINLFIFSYLVLNINLFIFSFLMSNFCFPKNIYFASRRERLLTDARPQFRILNSPRKMMTCYLGDTNKFLGYCTLCMSILKLTCLVLFEVVGVLQPWGAWVWTISVGTAQKSTEEKRSYKVRNFSVPD